jgi:transcriptional regulator with XRE-family HTH domain
MSNFSPFRRQYGTSAVTTARSFQIHSSERKIEWIRQLDSVGHRSTWKGLVRKKQEKSHCYRLPEMLHKLMKEQNLTAKALAQKSNVPRSTIGGWATGVKPLNLSDVRKVARALGCSFEYLIFGSEETEDVQQPRKAVRSMTFQNAHRITIEFIE